MTRPRRSGSGTTWGTRPLGTRARTRSTTCSASASAVASGTTSTPTGSRAHSISLHETCDGILTHTGEREPGRSGEDRPPRRPRRPTSTTSTPCATRLLSEDDLPHAEIATLGSTGSARIDRLVRHHRRLLGGRRRRPPVCRGGGGDALAARVHVRAHASTQAFPVPRGARRRADTSLFPPRRPRRRRQRAVDYVAAGMTDRFHSTTPTRSGRGASASIVAIKWLASAER